MTTNPFAGIRAVTFDVAGTLLVPHPSVGELYARALQKFGGRAEPDEIQQRFGRAFKQVNAGPRGGILDRPGWHEIVELTFAGLCPPEKVDDLFEALWEGFARAESWRVLPGTRELLTALRGHDYKLGILSNNDERLRRLLAALQLDATFDALILSAEVGAGKPDRAMFEAAEQALGEEPEHLLHIGDTPHEDIAGALAAGWRAIQIGERLFPSDKPGPETNDTSELPANLWRVKDLGELADCLAD